MTLFGRHDKNINDATSIYAGYDRYATTTTGGGVPSISVINNGTVGFTTAPTVYISNLAPSPDAGSLPLLLMIMKLVCVCATNTNVTALTSTLSNTVASSPIYALTITAGGNGFTGNPTLLFYGGGAPTTTATATCTQAGGAMFGCTDLLAEPGFLRTRAGV
jgi:hypothetical protein